MLRSVLCASAALWLGAGTVLAEPLRVVVMGDMPYGAPEQTYPPFERLVDAINARVPDLVIHVGDTKSGGSPCSDEMLADQRDFMMRIAAPLLYTPGDNEWTDCHRDRAGGFDPRERLAHIRATYFADPGQTPAHGRCPSCIRAPRAIPRTLD